MAIKKPLVINNGQVQQIQSGDYLTTAWFDPATNIGSAAALATNGITVHNGNAFTTVSLTAPASGMSITNADGIGGSPTFAFTGELSALLGLGNGMVAKTASGTLAARTITGTSNQITVTNGDGVSGAPTLSLSANPVLPGTGAVTVPTGTTGEQPGTPVVGMIRYNTTLGTFEFYEGSAWVSYGTSDATGTVTSVAATAPAAGFTISGSPITTTGTFTFALADDLAAVEGISTTGIAVRTAANTWSTVTIAGTAGNISVTNGGGVAGAPTIDLVDAGTAVTDQFVRITTDAKGRVTSTNAVTGANLTGVLGYTPVNKAGDTMSGNLAFGGTSTVTGLAAPTNSGDAATKNYVDSLITGLTWKETAAVATTANITLSGLQTIDGYSVQAGDRVLVKDQSTATQNGIYVAAAGAWTRSTDADTGAEINHATIFVEHGTLQAATGWTMNAAAEPVLGTDPITWVQFNGASNITAGVGLVKTGNVLDINLGAGIAQLPTDEVGIDLYDAASGALILTTDGTTRATTTGTQLHLLLNGTSLAQGASGLKINDSGVTAAMIAAAVAGDGLSGGAGTALSVNVDNSSIEINTDTLRVKAGGVTNAMLANSTMTFAGSTGTASAALGGTATFVGSNGLTTSATGSTVTIALSGGLDNLSDVTLTSVAAGHILYRDGSGQFVNGAPGATSGVQPYDATLAALASLTSTPGMVVESGTDAFVTRVIAGTAGRVTVTNGDGIAGDPTVDLATSGVTAGTYSRVTVDTYGRVTAGAAEANLLVSMTNANAGSLVIGTPVYVSTANNVDKSDADLSSTIKVVGLVADSSISAAAAGNIAVAGVVTATTGQWDAVTGGSAGLTAGATYYVSATAGMLTTTAPTTDGQFVAPVGTALSTTMMKVDIKSTIQL